MYTPLCLFDQSIAHYKDYVKLIMSKGVGSLTVSQTQAYENLNTIWGKMNETGKEL